MKCDPTKSDAAYPISGGCLNGPLLSFGIYGAIIVLVMLFRPGGLIPNAGACSRSRRASTTSRSTT